MCRQVEQTIHIENAPAGTRSVPTTLAVTLPARKLTPICPLYIERPELHWAWTVPVTTEATILSIFWILTVAGPMSEKGGLRWVPHENRILPSPCGKEQLRNGST